MFKKMYKNNNQLVGSQEERRQKLLRKQKEQRRIVQDSHRSLEEVLKEKGGRRNKRTYQQQGKLLSSFRKTYGVELTMQQSEWLRERPSDLCDWLLVPCPKGQRCLVVAYNRETVVYDKIGRSVCAFRSLLPGDGIAGDRFTILDCIHVRNRKCFYVLDVLAFGGTEDLLLCEAEFRFFWLRSKFSEHENLSQRSLRNQKPFHLTNHYDFDNPGSVAEAFQSYPLWPENHVELDGFLFYNRFALYTCGTTPLVGWLFAFMVPDLLDMEVSENYRKPPNYGDPLSYMDEFDKRLKKKWEKSRKRREDKSEEVDDVAAAAAAAAIKAPNGENAMAMALELKDEGFSPQNDECRMLEDAKSDSDDEGSLKKMLKSQMELELQ